MPVFEEPLSAIGVLGPVSCAWAWPQISRSAAALGAAATNDDNRIERTMSLSFLRPVSGTRHSFALDSHEAAGPAQAGRAGRGARYQHDNATFPTRERLVFRETPRDFSVW